MSPLEDLVTALRRLVPDFGRRRLTYDDFLTVCHREGIDITERDDGPDERILRGDIRPRISLRRGLAEDYRTFVAWHALGHYVLHPGPSTYYFERGWLDAIEVEASSVGMLALLPWPDGPPFPELRRAWVDDDRLALRVAYPDQLIVPRQWKRFGGDEPFRIGWQERTVVLRRLA
jgi:hypothetical protein